VQDPIFVSESQAAKLFSLSRVYLARLRETGQLQAGIHYSQISAHKRLYDVQAIRDWIMKKGSHAAPARR
jgi:hypothetical protein